MVVDAAVDVRLWIEGSCPDTVGTDIMLVLERSPRTWSWLKTTSIPFSHRFIHAANLDRDRVGLASYQYYFTPTVNAVLTSESRTPDIPHRSCVMFEPLRGHAPRNLVQVRC